MARIPSLIPWRQHVDQEHANRPGLFPRAASEFLSKDMVRAIMDIGSDKNNTYAGTAGQNHFLLLPENLRSRNAVYEIKATCPDKQSAGGRCVDR